MSIVEQFGNLRQRLPVTRTPAEDERLLQLFRNRAELKKEFSSLQDERHDLLERLKKQEASTQRAREQLEQLEKFLGNPEMGLQALAYFQLKGLWSVCSEKLTGFAEELRRQQEERERRRQLIEFDQLRRRKLAEADRKLLDLQSEAATLEARVRALESQASSLRGFWHYFKRRTLSEQTGAARMQWDVVATAVTDASDDRAAIESEPVPVFAGISGEGRRAVNTAVIAYAQQLVGQLAEGGLAVLAKETTVKRVYDVQYGPRDNCLRVMALVKAALASLADDKEDLVSLKARTDALRADATYRSDADTVPQTDSIGLLPVPASPVSDLESTVSAGINVLIDDYWDLYKALLP
jgi:predicted nuclease with TOPRIM domain